MSGIIEDFRAQLRQTLRRRIRSGTHLMIRLEDEPAIMRGFELTDESFLEAFASPEERFSYLMSHWQRVLSFRQLVYRTFQAVADLGPEDRGGGATNLWFSAVTVSWYAAKLLDQLGAPDDGRFDLSRIPGDFGRRYKACSRDAAGSWGVIRDFAQRCVNALQNRSLPPGVTTRPSYVRIVRQDREVSVEWMADDSGNGHLWREPLDTFLNTLIVEAQGADLAADLDNLRRTRRKHAEIGRSILAAVSPTLAEVVETALVKDGCVGLRLGTGQVRDGIPLSVWVYVDPRTDGEDLADVTLAAHRAHDEFILESSPPRRLLYYFPPSVLSAKLTVRNDAVEVVYWPTIMIPRGGCLWLHPYSGSLGATRISSAILLGDGAEPALRDPSPEALRIFPKLAERAGRTCENDLCLAGQKSAIYALLQRFNRRGREPDVLNLMLGLIDLVRLGLTRGHSRNDGSPRTSIRETFYPVPAGTLPRHLAERVFPYDPNTPVRVGCTPTSS